MRDLQSAFRVTLIVVILFGGACSIVASNGQCETSADCADKEDPAFLNTVCGPQKLCQPVLTAECKELFDGNQSAKFGEPGPQPKVIVGDTVLLSILQPLSGTLMVGGEARVLAARVALKEIVNDYSFNLPSEGGTKRRLAAVFCDQKHGAGMGWQELDRVLSHLIDTLGVPVIIGPQTSSAAVHTKEITVPRGVLMLSPSATSKSLRDDSQGLVWRTATSNEFEAPGMTKLATAIENALRAQGTEIQSGEPFKVATLYKDGDVYGRDLKDEIPYSLFINGQPLSEYPQLSQIYHVATLKPDLNMDRPGGGDIIDKLLNFKPHVIMFLGNAELVGVLNNIEQGVKSGAPRPYYVMPEGMKVMELTPFAALPTRPTPRIRIFEPRRNPTFDSRTEIPNTYGAPGTYDAIYLLVYSLVVTTGSPVNGRTLVEGLKRLTPTGDPPTPDAIQIDAGPSNLRKATVALSNGSNIDYNGVSGPLDFKVNTGDAPNNYDIFCLKPDSTGTVRSNQSFIVKTPLSDSELVPAGFELAGCK